MLPVEPPYKTYTGLDGKPLNNGYIYFGLPNQNPITAPVTVYWDNAGTIPAAQPLRTVNGYIMRAGTPANVFIDSSYSELVKDSKHRQVFYARNSGEFTIEFVAADIGSVPRSIQNKLRDIRSVKDMGAVGDDIADDLVAFQKCADIGGAWYVPDPLLAYRFSSTLTLTRPVKFFGNGVNALQDLSDPTNRTVINVRSNGPWLHFDHKGIGIKVIPAYFLDSSKSISALCDITINGLGSFRNQPLPVIGSAYTPDLTIDYDISAQDCFLNMDDFTFLNPTKAGKFRLSRFGHACFGRIRGQPMSVGFDIDATYGGVILGDVIWSKFWSFTAEVATYQLANTIGLRTGRIDGLEMQTYTANGHNICWQLVNSGSGVTGARCNKIYCDTGMIGIQVGVDAVGAQITVDELNIYGGGTGSIGMQIYADDFAMSAATTYIENISDYTFNLTGKRARLSLGAIRAKNWSLGRAAGDGRALFSTTVAVDTLIRFNSIDTQNNVDGAPFWQDGVAGLNNQVIGKIGGSMASYARDANGTITIPYRDYLCPVNPVNAAFKNSFPRPRSAIVSLINPGASLLPYVVGISDTQLIVEIRNSTTGATIGAGGSMLKWDLYA